MITLPMATGIELWPLDRFIPYARNARTHSDQQVAQIAASIREFGFTNPVLIDEEDGIIAGAGDKAAIGILRAGHAPTAPPPTPPPARATNTQPEARTFLLH